MSHYIPFFDGTLKQWVTYNTRTDAIKTHHSNFQEAMEQAVELNRHAVVHCPPGNIPDESQSSGSQPCTA